MIKKKLIYTGMVLLLAAVLVFCLPERAYAEDIDLDNIKDSNFRQYILSNFDKDNDGAISDDEAADVTTLDIRNQGIQSLDGIEMFYNLTELNCTGNLITSLDMSGNPKLQSLTCAENEISYLNVSQNPELLNLNCTLNDLNGIDVSNNTKLETLQCGGNANFGTVDLSHNAELSAFLYVGGSMEEIDLVNNTELESLWISTTPLKELDVSANRKLVELYCNATDVATIDLRNNTNLQTGHVSLSGNRLISLHSNSNIGANIAVDGQRTLKVTVPAGETSYDLKNIDPYISAEYIRDPNGGTMDGTLVNDIYDGMKIAYTYTESGIDMHSSIEFHVEEKTPVDPPDGGQGTDPGTGSIDEDAAGTAEDKTADKAAAATGDGWTWYPALLALLAAAGASAVIFTERKRSSHRD